MLRIHVQAVSDVAISGPNGLDLIFPSRYHFSKSYCERPDVISRLQQLVEEVTGEPVRIATKLVDVAVAAQPMSEPRPVPKLVGRRPLEAGNDEFVQTALSVFGATIVKVDELSTPTEETPSGGGED